MPTSWPREGDEYLFSPIPCFSSTNTTGQYCDSCHWGSLHIPRPQPGREGPETHKIAHGLPQKGSGCSQQRKSNSSGSFVLVKAVLGCHRLFWLQSRDVTIFSAGVTWAPFFFESFSSPLVRAPAPRASAATCLSAVLQRGRMFSPMGRKGFVSAWREGSGEGDEEQHASLQTMRQSALLLP